MADDASETLADLCVDRIGPEICRQRRDPRRVLAVALDTADPDAADFLADCVRLFGAVQQGRRYEFLLVNVVPAVASLVREYSDTAADWLETAELRVNEFPLLVIDTAGVFTCAAQLPAFGGVFSLN